MGSLFGRIRYLTDCVEGENMDISKESPEESLSYEEKNHQLYLQQIKSLELFLERGAISREQYETSLRVLAEKSKGATI